MVKSHAVDCLKASPSLFSTRWVHFGLSRDYAFSSRTKKVYRVDTLINDHRKDDNRDIVQEHTQREGHGAERTTKRHTVMLFLKVAYTWRKKIRRFRTVYDRTLLTSTTNPKHSDISTKSKSQEKKPQQSGFSFLPFFFFCFFFFFLCFLFKQNRQTLWP